MHTNDKICLSKAALAAEHKKLINLLRKGAAAQSIEARKYK